MNIKIKISQFFVLALIAKFSYAQTNCEGSCNSDSECASTYFLKTQCYSSSCCEPTTCTKDSLDCQTTEVGTSSSYCSTGPKCEKPLRKERKIQYCFDGITPWANEPKCELIDQIRYICRTDDKRSRGTCRFGHCCPQRRINMKKPVLSQTNYRTNINCDPTIPLSPVYQYAFCDNNKKVWLLGTDSLDTGKIKPTKTCRIRSDCATQRVCVNLMHGVRVCMFDTDHEMNPLNPKVPWYDFSQITD